MDDTISRQQAIATAVSAAIDWHRLANPQYSIAYSIGEAMRALPPAQRWIPCKTALPEHDGEYLVTKKSFGWNCTGYIETDIARYEKKNGWHKADQVIAWMPLPDSWEGGEHVTSRAVLSQKPVR